MKYIKTFESFENGEKIDEGLKDITAGVLLAVATLLGGKANAQAKEIAPDYEPTKKEIAQAEKIKNYLDKHGDYTEVDTIFNFGPQDSLYNKFTGSDKELRKPELVKLQQTIKTTYFDKKGNRIGDKTEKRGEYETGDRFGSDTYTKYASKDNERGFPAYDDYKKEWDTRLGDDSTFYKHVTKKGDTYQDYNQETGSHHKGDWRRFYAEEDDFKYKLDSLLQKVSAEISGDSTNWTINTVREKFPEYAELEKETIEAARKYPETNSDLPSAMENLVKTVLRNKRYVPLKRDTNEEQ
jgi:hypothetical protein